MAKLKIGWAKYTRAVASIAEYFNGAKFDVLIGLTRGGLIPAVCLSHIMDTPVLAFNPHLLHSGGELRTEMCLPLSPETCRRILIVDDISDTGKTFIKCTRFFENMGFNVSTTAVYINKKTTNFTPTYVVYDSHKRWVVFPYEVE